MMGKNTDQMRVIAVDLDGTLLRNNKELSDYTLKVIKKCIEAGYRLIPATGRALTALPENVLNIRGIDYAITSNGARIIRLPEKETISASLLGMESSEKVMNIVRNYDTLREIYYEGQGYFQRDKQHIIHRYTKDEAVMKYILETRMKVDSLDGFFYKKNQDIDKIHILFAREQDKTEAFQKLCKIEDIEISSSLKTNIEVNAKGVNKGEALERLSDILGFSVRATLAFGDGGNDMKMLEKAGWGVAMSNGDVCVKARADDVALSNEEDGVAKYIETHLFKKNGNGGCYAGYH